MPEYHRKALYPKNGVNTNRKTKNSPKKKTFLKRPKMPLECSWIFSSKCESADDANGIFDIGSNELIFSFLLTCRPPSRGLTDTMCSKVLGREMIFESRFFFFLFFPKLSSTCFSFSKTEISRWTTSSSRC